MLFGVSGLLLYYCCLLHYAMRAVKDMGQQVGYRSLERNWPKEATNIPIGAGIVDGAKLF